MHQSPLRILRKEGTCFSSLALCFLASRFAGTLTQLPSVASRTPEHREGPIHQMCGRPRVGPSRLSFCIKPLSEISCASVRLFSVRAENDRFEAIPSEAPSVQRLFVLWCWKKAAIFHCDDLKSVISLHCFRLPEHVNCQHCLWNCHCQQ